MNDNLKLIPEVFFDFLAYFLPGSFFILSISYLKTEIIEPLISNLTIISEILIFVLCGYICGHILTTLSTILCLALPLVEKLNMATLGSNAAIAFVVSAEEIAISASS